MPGFWYVSSLVLATAVSAGLLLSDYWLYHYLTPNYMLWNLCLAWIPFVLVLWLLRILRRRAWSSWEGLCATAVWLAFLPNSFYMISDFIHLADITNPDQLLFSAVMFTSFIYTGVLLGLTSLYLVHEELRRRLASFKAAACVVAILAICSLAIYVGRDLRWNTWDILVDPAGVLFDVSSRLLQPSQYGTALQVILPFFVLLLGMYTAFWQGVGRLKERVFLRRH